MRIFLIGFMGSGKSHWGKIWAPSIELPFLDLDDIIEKKLGSKIADIFENQGEAFFRKVEAETLRSMILQENCLVACGGGTACFEGNMEWMKEHGLTVYLSATPKQLFDNIMSDEIKRPLIKNINAAEILYFVEQKLKERQSFYLEAAKTLLVSELTNHSMQDLLETDN